MTTVNADQFDSATDLAFYQALQSSGGFKQTQPIFESASEISIAYTDGTDDFVLQLFGSNLTYSGATPIGGTVTGLSFQKAPGQDTSQQYFAFGLFGLKTPDGHGGTSSGIPVSTVDGWLTSHDSTAIFNALFSGDDTFNVSGPGPNLIDGGPGDDTVVFSSNVADNLVVVDPDGSTTVTGAAGMATLRNVEHFTFNGGTFTAPQIATIADIQHDYVQLAGRAPTADELTYWTGALAPGAPETPLVKALASPDNPRPADVVDTLYQIDLGRPASQTEVNYWVGALRDGAASVDQIAAALSSPQISPQAAQNVGDTVQSIYQLFYDRAATADEVGFWSGRLQSAQSTVKDFERALVTPDYSGFNLQGGIEATYQVLVGRLPTDDEFAYWFNAFKTGADTLDALRAGLTFSAEGQTHLSADVRSSYQTAFGRDPTGDETSYWIDQIQNHGVSVAQVEQDVVQSAPFQVAANMIVLFDEFRGREPTSLELSDAVGRLNAGVVQTPQLQHEIIRDEQIDDGVLASAGGYDVAGKVGDLYHLYFGTPTDGTRLPADSALILADTNAVEAGESLQSLAQTLLARTAGQAYIGTEIGLLYATYGGYTATQDYKDFWKTQLNSGQATYASISDLLATLTNDGVHTHHVDMATDATNNGYAIDAKNIHHLVVTDFVPGTSHLDFSFDYLNFTPLADAEQVGSGASADVLITFDPDDTILLKGVLLTQLHAADFHFGAG